MSLNKVILIGYAGKDPDVRYFDSTNVVAKFSLATSERGFKLANGTEVPERTEWHNIVVYRDRAQFVEKYVKKGSLLYVEGKIRYSNYDDKDGIKHYITEIYADRIEFMPTSSGSREGAAQSANASATPAASPTKSDVPTPTEIPQAPEPADDLPF
ncbi:MAG: single-stranded DNA-binding protein [Tannerella sp.]|jgi:single-strand DNA-binding protein|nr:single-stranded DNA-binding protein [Tannerella sp.]